jgi:hypothetical protein
VDWAAVSGVGVGYAARPELSRVERGRQAARHSSRAERVASINHEESTVLSSYADFLIQGEPENVRAIGDEVVRGVGFTTVWDDYATGHAKRGSLALTILLGVFVGKRRQSMKVDLTIFAGPRPGMTVLRLTSASSGWAGGVIGASRNKKMFAELIQVLVTPFGQAGILLGVDQG